jgi:hypothetical protein
MGNRIIDNTGVLYETVSELRRLLDANDSYFGHVKNLILRLARRLEEIGTSKVTAYDIFLQDIS